MRKINLEEIIKTYKPKIKIQKSYCPDEQIVKQVLYGIMVGDIAGSVYENGKKETKETYQNINLLGEWNTFTDDSVMSYAVYKATKNIKEKNYSDTEAIDEYSKQMRHYAQLYPDVGYGGHFYQWAVRDVDDGCYESWGDGAAMRSGIIGALFPDVYSVIRYAALSAMPTHSHPEGVKGSVITAVLVWMGLHKYTKKEMKKYIEKHCPKPEKEERYLNPVHPQLKLEELLKKEKYQTEALDCKSAVSLAWINFFESDSYEKCLRNCLLYFADTDTVMAISGGIAAGYYKDKITFQGRDLTTIINEKVPEDIRILGELCTSQQISDTNY